MDDLSAFGELVPLDHGLCVITTLRADGSVHATVVNAGVLTHPLTGARVVGLIAAAGSRKLDNLRADPRCTIVVRAGWRWATVEGVAQVIGPDDPDPGIDPEALRLLWDGYDRTMADERRSVVLITPQRTYTNLAH